MKRTLTIELPWPPRGLSPNARLKVFPKAQLFRETKMSTLAVAKKALGRRTVKLAKDDRMNLTLICTPPVMRYRDEDNLIANCKATFDGLALALGIDDHLFHFREQVWHEPKKPGSLVIFCDWMQEEP